MKRKRIISNILCGLAILLSIGGFVAVAKATTVSLDVTASNVTGMSSKDPYSKRVAKSDSEQNFYITLTSLTNGPSMSFKSYNDANEIVSSNLTITKGGVNSTKHHSYDKAKALAGAKYYVRAIAPQYFANVHAVGRYCP